MPQEIILVKATSESDREGLIHQFDELADEELSALSFFVNPAKSRGDEGIWTATEIRLRALWAKVLKIEDVKQIGRQDNFFKIGGDSITTIDLVSSAQLEGINLIASEVFANLELSAMAMCIDKNDNGVTGDSQPYVPFQLLREVEDVDSALKQIAQACSSDVDSISDAYPCTPLQEGLMSLTFKQPGSYVARHVFKLPDTIDITRLKGSWQLAARLCDVLRTRMVQLYGGLIVQVVMDEEIDWEEDTCSDIGAFIKSNSKAWMSHGTRLSQFSLVRAPRDTYLVWTIHHAITDGWSQWQIFSVVQKIYEEGEDRVMASWQERTPFRKYIDYILSTGADASAEFWKQQFSIGEEAPAVHFPVSNKLLHNASPSRHQKLHHVIPSVKRTDTDFTVSTILRAAWSIVLSRWAESADVAFGTVVSGRNAPVPGIDLMFGPTFATLPMHVRLPGVDRKDSIIHFLSDIQSASNAMIPHEHFGLQNISRLSPQSRDACDFQNLLIIQPDHEYQNELGIEMLDDTDTHGIHLHYPLVVECLLSSEDAVTLRVAVNADILPTYQAESLCRHFGIVVKQLIESDAKMSIHNISLLDIDDEEQILAWNREAAKNVTLMQHTVPEMFAQIAKTRSATEAICSSPDSNSTGDFGSWTYAELDAASDRLARFIMSLTNIEPGSLIPLCFEHNAWYVIAVMAVLKSGAAFVPLDPKHPKDRRQEILEQIDAKILLGSPMGVRESVGMVDIIVRVTEGLDHKLCQEQTDISPVQTNVTPLDLAYIIFTSGSTGKPKGVMISHAAVYTSMMNHYEPFGYTPTSGAPLRALQFASHVFDASIAEIIGILLYGGTICIPSDAQRMDPQLLADFMTASSVSWAFFTPIVAQLLSQIETPTLEALVCGGELVTAIVVRPWVELGVKFITAYGPTEACVFTSANEVKDAALSSLIGRGAGYYTWIVDPNDHSKLTPIGCVGELLLQGPCLARGYLNDDAMTASSFAPLPNWGIAGVERAGSMAYRTGDLVRYHDANGELEYVARKDTQIKLHGQRLELGDIEQHLRSLLPNLQHIVADILRSAEKLDNDEDALAVFFCISDDVHTNVIREDEHSLLRDLSADEKKQLSSAVARLENTLPSYMIPSLYIPLNFLPTVTSTKTDRKLLKRLAAQIPNNELREAYSLEDADGKVHTPVTAMEKALQLLWAEVLHVSAASIGLDNSFIRLGGDSISSMRLVSAAHSKGILLSVADILQHPTLRDMAAVSEFADGEQETDLNPIKFSLLPSSLGDSEKIAKEIARQCDIESAQIADAYPVTALQEGLMSLSLQMEGTYFARNVYKLAQSMDIYRLKGAWQATHNHFNLLRTRLVMVRGQMIQAVMNDDEEIDFQIGNNVHEYIESDKSRPFSFGEPMVRYAATTNPDSGESHVVVTMHHAIYDGWSIQIISQYFLDAFQSSAQRTPDPAPFSRFIKYTVVDSTSSASEQYWLEQSQGVEVTPFPQSRQGPASESDWKLLKKELSLESLNSSKDVTTNVLLRAAWALTVAAHADVKDVVFGATVSGRNAPVAGIENIAGPTFATVPLRFRLQDDMLIDDFLDQVHQASIDIIPHQQFGMLKIRKLGSDAENMCAFKTLLVVQAPQEHVSSSNSKLGEISGIQLETDGEDIVRSYPVTMECIMQAKKIMLSIHYDASIIPVTMMKLIASHFCQAVNGLSSARNTSTKPTLGSLRLFTELDDEIIRKFTEDTKIPPRELDTTIHGLVQRQSIAQPEAQAIYGWDLTLTYSELNSMAEALARHLVFELGAKMGSLVPICMEKSTLALIAMLAINMSGAGWVPLEPSHPINRRVELIKETRAQIILADRTTIGDFTTKILDQHSCENVNIVSISLKAINDWASRDRSIENKPVLPLVPSSAPAYTLFTSGSTGKPKGVVMSHRGACSGMVAQSSAFFMNSATRSINFASFVFDLCIIEVFGCWIVGGCVTVPSEKMRLSGLFAEFMVESKTNWSIMTPAVATTINPKDVPNLKVLTTAGDVIRKENVNTWMPHATLLNGYGPTETCCVVLQHQLGHESEVSLIGKAVGCRAWVSMPNDFNTLAPVGCVGELLIQGPSLADGYLHDTEKTNAVFVTPNWLSGSEYPMVYRTGDLVRYTANGDVEYLGRRDAQLKLRGQRLEPGEIEHQILIALMGESVEDSRPDAQVVVTLLKDVKVVGAAELTAFIRVNDVNNENGVGKGNSLLLPSTENFRTLISNAVRKIKLELPTYMVPSLYVPVKTIPLGTAGKVDKRALEAAAKSLSWEQYSLTNIEGSDSIKQPPTTDMERMIQSLWCSALSLAPESIGRNDEFLQIGGDSVSALWVSTAARDANIEINVATIFKHPKLKDLARECEVRAAAGIVGFDLGVVEPFALLRDVISPASIHDVVQREIFPASESISEIADAYPYTSLQEGVMALTAKEPGTYVARIPFGLANHVVREASKQCDVSETLITDAFPCTPLQEGFIALAEKQPGSYIARFALSLPKNVDIVRFKDIMAQMYALCSNLRTRIVLVDGDKIFQIIINESIAWNEIYGDEPSLGEVLRQNRESLNATTGFGKRLSFFNLIHDSTGNRHLVWDIHHSIYDGWTLGIMLDILQKLQRGDMTSESKPLSFANYVKYTLGSSRDEEASNSFWQSQFSDANISHFPKAITHDLSDDDGDSYDSKMSHNFTLPPSSNSLSHVTLPTVLRAAWALLLSVYLDSNDVIFGNTVSGRSASIKGITRIAGPTIGTLPIRVRLYEDDSNKSTTVRQFLERMQVQSIAMIPYEHLGLQTIAKMGDKLRDACKFQNLLVIQPGGSKDVAMDKGDPEQVNFLDINDLTSSSSGNTLRYQVYPLVFQCILESSESIKIDAMYDKRIISAEKMNTICHHFSQAVTQLLTAVSAPSDVLLSSISLASQYDISMVKSWVENDVYQIHEVNERIHDIVSQRSVHSPNKQAIYAWDGTMSYNELEQTSTRLASHLTKLGVDLDTFVPICCEKSMWTIVAMLGIMKAGGAFVPIDPTHPFSRRQALIDEISNAGNKVKILISSPSTATSCQNLTENIIVLSSSFISQLPHLEAISTTNSCATANAAYAIFTSGSTGKPKCVVMEHRSLCSSIAGHGRDMGLNSDSRVLQFSNYIYDGSLGEILTTLAFGGTICVPSDNDRTDGGLSAFITECAANTALLTPSVLSLLSPEEVPTLKTIILGGEAPTRDNLQIWHGHAKILNGYGPAEACIVCSVSEFQTAQDNPTVIGRGSNFNLWIVDANDSSQLAPIGCLGELLLEGPGLARGYLNNDEATKKAFIELDTTETVWIDTSSTKHVKSYKKRFYKTGDLARYNEDGRVEYVGRKDTQVKLHGQRIELGEIEHRIKASNTLHASIRYSVVNLLHIDGREALVGAVSFSGIDSSSKDMPVIFMMMTDSIRLKFIDLLSELQMVLPPHMVPKYFILVSHMPKNTSGKIDRRALREQIGTLSSSDLQAYFISPINSTLRQHPVNGLLRGSREPSNALEVGLRGVWATILNLKEESIGVDDDFYQLGGDSIRVITMSKQIRQRYDVALNMRLFIGQNTTIAKIASAVTAKKLEYSTFSKDEPHTKEIKIDLVKEIKNLSDKAHSSQWLNQPISSLPSKASIFLTGATGFLGTEILRQLLSSCSVQRVVALVRAKSTQDGHRRIEKTALIAGWWSSLDNKQRSKLEVWTGDLSLPHLGVSPEQWAQISGHSDSGSTINAIIHNGATVNWHADFESLRAANVNSTVDLLAAATASSNIKFVFVSGGVKIANTQTNQSFAATELSKSGTGYVLTKFLAESIVYEVATSEQLTQVSGMKQQNRVSIVKPGAVLGPVPQGVSNTDDYLWRLVAAAVAIGFYPSEPQEHWLYFDDSKSIAASVLNQLMIDVAIENAAKPIDPFIDIQSGLTVPDFWNVVNEELISVNNKVTEDTQLRPLSWDEWTPIALAHMEQVGETHPLWPVQHFLGRTGTGNTSPQQQHLSPEDTSRLRTIVRSNVQYLMNVGFIQSSQIMADPGKKFPMLNGDVFRRSNMG